MFKKKPYKSPKLFRVELNQDQAILVICSTTTGNASASDTKSCRADECRRSSKGGGDDGASAS